MTSEDVSSECKELNDLYKKCESAKKSIKFTNDGLREAYESYKIDRDSVGIDFILNKVRGNVIGICDPQYFHYNSNLPLVHEFVFIYNLENGEKGCLAFYHNPRNKEQIKIFVKSLHSNYQDKKFEEKHVYYLTQEEKMKLLE